MMFDCPNRGGKVVLHIQDAGGVYVTNPDFTNKVVVPYLKAKNSSELGQEKNPASGGNWPDGGCGPGYYG